MKAKCQKEPDNDSLNAIFQKLKTALGDLQNNGFLLKNSRKTPDFNQGI